MRCDHCEKRLMHLCFYKILEGNLIEYLYDNNINLIEMKNLPKNDINYIDDTIGYHKMNNNEDYGAVSIHLYSPPELSLINEQERCPPSIVLV